MARVIPNKFAGNCASCGARVSAEAGRLAGKDKSGRWQISHLDGECATVKIGSATVPGVVTAAYTPTDEQEEVRRLYRTGQHLVVEAGAGAGKTSTIILCANDTPNKSIIYTAFNRRIVDDSGSKLPKNASAKGIHQLAWAVEGRKYEARRKASRSMKSFEIARILGIKESLRVGERELSVSFLGSLAIRTFTKFCTQAEDKITEKHVPFVDGLCPVDDEGNIDYTNQNTVAKFIVPFARKAWADLVKTEGGKLPYRQEVYLKVWQLNSPFINAEVIFVDEAQDMSPVMLSILLQQTHAQIVAIGDSCQSINEWMGSINALTEFKKLDANVAWLTKSFRFGPAVAEVANSILARIEGATLRLEGFEKLDSTVGPIEAPRAVLTRTNAFAVRTVLEAIDADRKPFLVGGGTEVLNFAKGALVLQEGGRTQHHELACFDSWTEVVEYVESGEDGGELKLLVELIEKFGVERIITALDNQVSEAAADLVVSTTHKCKGLEWESVFVAGDFIPSKKRGKLTTADLKLLYVAVTRAKDNLDVSAVLGILKGYSGATEGSEEDVA